MCRHLAYLGPPITAASLLFDASHALAQQSRAPRHMEVRSGDGFGVGWFAEDGCVASWRTLDPIWEAGSRTPAVECSAFMAAARAATPGLPVDVSCNAPFSLDGFLFSLNGSVEGYRAGRDRELRAMVSRRRRDAIRADVDTALVFALVLDQLDLQVSPREALANVHAILRPRSSLPLNLLLMDGTRIAATASGHALHVLDSGDAVTVASEPLDDDDRWTRVPDGALVDARPGAVHIVPLNAPFMEAESVCSRPATSLIGAD